MAVLGIGKVKCGDTCGISRKCKRKRDCACECGRFLKYSPAIHQSCVDECNSNYNLDHDKWECQNKEAIFNASGTLTCGYSVQETVQWQVEAENQRQREVQANWQKDILFKVLPWIGAILIGGLLYLITKD